MQFILIGFLKKTNKKNKQKKNKKFKNTKTLTTWNHVTAYQYCQFFNSKK